MIREKPWDGLFDGDLGAGVCGDEVSQAPADRGLPLVDTATAFADHAMCHADCQAVHGAAACRCSAEPTPKPPTRSGGWNNSEMTSLLSCGGS